MHRLRDLNDQFIDGRQPRNNWEIPTLFILAKTKKIISYTIRIKEKVFFSPSTQIDSLIVVDWDF